MKQVLSGGETSTIKGHSEASSWISLSSLIDKKNQWRKEEVLDAFRVMSSRTPWISWILSQNNPNKGFGTCSSSVTNLKSLSMKITNLFYALRTVFWCFLLSWSLTFCWKSSSLNCSLNEDKRFFWVGRKQFKDTVWGNTKSYLTRWKKNKIFAHFK